MTNHPHAQLSALADGELSPLEAQAVERHLESCTECLRELALVRQMKGAVRMMQTQDPRRDLWPRVHRRLTRPVGWIMMLAGLAIWSALAAVQWWRSELTLEWLAGTAMVIGFLLLTVGIGYEQYRDWKESRYKDVER